MNANTTPSSRPTRPVTRVEIADLVEHLFDGRYIHRNDLLDTAERAHARAAIQVALTTLPDRAYLRLGDLWHDLPSIPIDDD